MKVEFDNAYIKVWFNAHATSRNFYNVTEIAREGSTAIVKTKEGNQTLLNMDNVTLIEELTK